MRTTLDIDDALMNRLLESYPCKSKTQAVEHAIREYLYSQAAEALISLAGTIDVDEEEFREMKAAELRREEKLRQLWES
jgi:Arc/MetJ family transcription regulator